MVPAPPSRSSTRLTAVALGAISAVIPWAIVDTARLSSSGIPWFSALTIAALGATAMAIPGAILAWAALAMGRRCAARDEMARFASPVFWVPWLVALCGVCVAAYSSIRLADAFFSGEGVKRLAICGAATVVSLLFFGAASALSLRRHKEVGRRKAATIAAIGVAALLGAAGFFYALERDVFVALELWKYLPLLTTMGIAVVCGMALPPSRKLLGAAIAVGALLFSGAVLQIVRPVVGQHRAIADERALGARWALDAVSIDDQFVGPGSGGAALSCFPGTPSAATTPLRAKKNGPDIIWVTVDALRWDHTTMSGYERNTSPQLARFAARGTLFSAAFSPSNSTRQTFPSLFTGFYPSMARDNATKKSWAPSIPANMSTIAEYLSAVGYDTVAVVSAPSIFYKKSTALAGFTTVDDTPTVARKKLGYSSPYQIDRIVAHLSTYRKNRPMFVWAHLMDTHQPYESGPHPARFGDDEVAAYDAAIRFSDEGLGRLLDFALGSARRDKTFVIVTADHGQAFGDHKTRFHGQSLYQEETRVPLVVLGPKVAPQKISTPVSLVDLAPSIIDIAGIAPLDSLCGRSLKPVWEKKSPPPRRPVYMEVSTDAMVEYAAASFIDGDMQLVVNPKYGTKELYDIANDPFQRSDLASAQPKTVESLVSKLQAFHRERAMAMPR